MLKVIFQVWGTYTHGKLAGRVNPKSLVEMTFYGQEVRDAVSKLGAQTDGAFYKIKSVENIELA